MWDLYILTRLDEIKDLLSDIFGFCLFAGVITFFASVLIFACSQDTDEYEGYMGKHIFKIMKPWWYVLVIVAILARTVDTFIPTAKEGIIIYGAGNTLEYLKENPTAKQLPDKVIVYLDEWIDQKINDVKQGNDSIK